MSEWGELILQGGKLTKNFPTHIGQFDVLDAKAKYCAAISGSGGGKTALGALWLMREIQKKPLGKFLIVTPTFKILRSATLPAWKATVQGTDLEGEYKVADSEYTLPTGGVIYLRSADDPSGAVKSLQGIVASAAWIDEGGLISKEAWDTVCQRVGYQRGRVLVTTTPYTFNWLHSDFFTRWKAGDKNYFVRQFSSLENPTYPREEYARAKATLPPHKFRMLYEGEWCRAEGLVYPELGDCVIPYQQVPDGRLTGGVDFGFNDPFVAIAGVLDKEDILWLFFERYKRQETLDEHAKHLPKEVEWFADSSRPDSIKDFRRMGFMIRPAKKRAGSIEQGINLVHQRIKAGKLKVIENTCPNMLFESETYHYPSQGEETSGDVPIAQHDHAMDALRYLITSIDRRKEMVF